MKAVEKTRDSKKRIAFPIHLGSQFSEQLSDDGFLEMHVVPVGEWDHPAYGEMRIETADIAKFVSNFKAGLRKELPITAGHDAFQETPAVAWFKDLYDRGVNGLWGLVQFNAEGKRLLRSGAFKYFSPEFYEEYEDPVTGQKYEHVLVGGALTNKPFFRELEAPVMAFSEPAVINQFSDKNMNLADILAKKTEDLNDEERGFLREHKDELTDEQSTQFASVLEDGGDEGGEGSEGGDEGGEGAGDGAGAAGDAGGSEGEGDDGGEGTGEPVTASGGDNGKYVRMSEAEVSLLKEKANKGQQAFAELETMRLNEAAGRMIFSETNESGKFAPKQRDAIVKFMRKLSETQRDQFINLVNNMPKMQVFGEIGDGGNSDTPVAKEVENAVQEKIKASEGKMRYSDALKAVFAENADLAKRYDESLGA